MAEKLCTLRTQGGGGGAKVIETVLWTNPAPTTDFNAQTVTISDDINNYDYIKVNYTYSSTVASAYSVIMPVSVFKQAVYPAVNYTPSLMLGVYASLFNARSIYYVSDTSVRIGSAANVGSSGSSNNRAIPTQIVGIKNMGGKIDNKTVSGSVSMDSSGATSTIDVGFRPKKLFVYANISSNGIINCSYDESISATTYIRGMKYGSSNLLVAISNFGGTNNGINAIEDNGFKLFNNMSQLAGTWYYTAVKA